MVAAEPGVDVGAVLAVGECADCTCTAPLGRFGKVDCCPACLLSRRRVARILAGEAERRPPAERQHGRRERLKFVGRWFTFPGFEPLTGPAVRSLRDREHRVSADGNWLEFVGEDGLVTGVLVRVFVVAGRRRLSIVSMVMAVGGNP